MGLDELKTAMDAAGAKVRSDSVRRTMSYVTATLAGQRAQSGKGRHQGSPRGASEGQGGLCGSWWCD